MKEKLTQKYWEAVRWFSQWRKISEEVVADLFDAAIGYIFTALLCGIALNFLLFIIMPIEPILYPFAAGFSLIMAVVLWIVLVRKKHYLARDNPRWNEHKARLTLADSMNAASGIILGKNYRGQIACSREDEEGMCLCIGAPGSGKTTGVVIWSVIKWVGNVFAIDIAGDITSAVLKHRENARVIKIGTDDYEDSASYDIMHDIDEAVSDYERIEAIELLANQLYPDSPGFDSTADYYNKEARALFIAAFLYFYDIGADFVEICDFIVSSTADTLLEMIMLGSNEEAKKMASGNLGIAGTLLANIKQTVDRKISHIVTNPLYRKILHREKEGQASVTSHSLDETDVFIQVPEHKLDDYKSILSLIVTQNLSYLTQRNGYDPILFMVDEFARLDKMPMITSALMTLRKRRVRMVLCMQSIASLNKLYGRYEAQEIIDCCSLKILLEIHNQETQEMLSKTIGEDYQFVRNDRRHYDVREGYTLRREKYRIVSPEEFGYLGDHLIVINRTGYDKLYKLNYFNRGVSQ